MHRSRLLLAIGSLCLLVFLPSCSEKLSKQTGLTDADLFSRGQKGFAARNYGDAIEAFQVLIERFPNSPLAAKAQLGLAEARMENRDDVEAEVAYDDFLRLYPADENVPYALYRKGELLARQAHGPGRDQTKALEAIKALNQVLEKNPKGPYVEKAAAKTRELRNRLAEHEERVVSHYLARKQYVSAEARARRTLSEYPESGAVPSLLSLLAEALDKQDKKAEAAEVRKSLAEKYPGAGGRKR
ncbi:MAG: outer membrane protein assembly factor BamD [Deltaproteobacteria bacterium]|nr:outer membrane protein assembly factor BamD [Deltaproteobacteria bacterium]